MSGRDHRSSITIRSSSITGSPLNETHDSDPTFDALFYKAQAETNETQTQALWNRVQQYQYDNGDAILWV